MKLTALTNVGRMGRLPKGKIVKGTWNDIYKELDASFCNGCMLERVKGTNHWKVFAGYGSHVADIELEGTKEELAKL